MEKRLCAFTLALLLLLTCCPASLAAGTEDDDGLFLALAEGKGRLTRDLFLTGERTMTIQKETTLDLNGHTLTIDLIDAQDVYGSKYLFTVMAPLNIIDSQGDGKLICKNATAIFRLTTAGKLVFHSGTMTGENLDALIHSSGEYFQLNGILDGNGQTQGIVANRGKLIISAGEIRNCHAVRGSAIFAGDDASVCLMGGSLHDNTAERYGGAVHSTGIIAMWGGDISNNTASYGGGIYTEGDTVILKGVINGNTASNKGGGIYCGDGARCILIPQDRQPHTIQITNNSALDPTPQAGGGICGGHSEYINKTPQIYILDACITGNSAGEWGGGVSTCAASDTNTIENNGSSIFGNTITGESSFPDALDIWCSSYGSVAGTGLWDDPVRYVGKKYDEPVGSYRSSLFIDTATGVKAPAFSSEMGESVTGSWLQLTMDTSALPPGTLQQWYESAPVLIEGNSVLSSGGGIASNGLVRIGGHAPKVNLEEPAEQYPDRELPTGVTITSEASSEADRIEKEIILGSEVPVYDTVTYDGVTPGQPYVLHTFAYLKEESRVLADSKTTSFTPTETRGTITVDFPCYTRAYPGKTVVVAQELYAWDGSELIQGEDKVSLSNGQLVATHTSRENESQLLYITKPAISTRASASRTETVKEVPWADDAVIYDTISYTGFEPNKEYKIVTTVYDTKTELPVIGPDNAVTTSFTADTRDGEVTVEIPISTKMWSEQTLVIYESVYTGDAQSSIWHSYGSWVTSHCDLNDEAQQITVEAGDLSIDTQAKVMGERNGQSVEFIGNTRYDVLPVQEKADFEALRQDQEYVAVFQILDKRTGKVLSSREKSFQADEVNLSITMPNLYVPLKSVTGNQIVLGIELHEDSADGPVAAGHMDLMDLDETVTITKSTTADISTQIGLTQGEGLSRLSDWTLRDDISIDNEGKWIEGGYLLTQILNKETQEVLFERERQVNDRDGGWDHLSTEFSESASGKIVSKSLQVLHGSEGALPAASLAGTPLVVYQTLMYYGEPVAHTDLSDPKQTFVFDGPKMTTSASCGGLRLVTLEETNEIEDHVTITDLPSDLNTLPAGSTLKGCVINRGTLEIIAESDRDLSGAVVTNGTLETGNSFRISFKDYDNTELVIMEELVIDGKTIVSHEDLNEPSQTISVSPQVPEIVTSAQSDIGEQKVTNTKVHAVTDSVHLSKLKRGVTYTLKATLADAQTGEEFEGSEHVMEFIAEDAVMDVENTLSYLAYAPPDTRVVVFERLYIEDELVAEHTDRTDANQTLDVTGVTFTTRASDEKGNKEIKISGYTALSDYLSSPEGSFKGDDYYVVRTWLVDKETGKQLEQDGQPLSWDTTIEMGIKGSLDHSVEFALDSHELAGRTLVVFEELYTASGILIGSHKDITDTEQTVSFVEAPSIATTAAGEDGSKLIPSGTAEIWDTVFYTGLVPGETYRVVASLADIDAGDIVTSATSSLTPAQSNGNFTLSLVADTRGRESHTLVVYEEIFDAAGRLALSHVDAGNTKQQVYVGARLRTTALAENGTHFTVPAQNTVITDTAVYTGLAEGRQYDITARLCRSDTGQVLSEKKFAVWTEPGKDSFSVTFDTDTSELSGVRLAVTYEISIDGRPVCRHSDLSDMSQSIFVEPETAAPSLTTDARLSDGTRQTVASAGDTVDITDTLICRGLAAGTQYRVITRLLDRETGTEAAPAVTAMRTADDTGTWIVPLKYTVGSTRDHAVVVCQEIQTMDGTQVLLHDDLTDICQTITVLGPQIRTRAQEKDATLN